MPTYKFEYRTPIEKFGDKEQWYEWECEADSATHAWELFYEAHDMSQVKNPSLKGWDWFTKGAIMFSLLGLAWYFGLF